MIRRYRARTRYRGRMRRRYRSRISRSRVRMARRGVFPRPRTRAYAEVKYADIYLDQKGVIMETSLSPSAALLRGSSIQHANLLDNIPVGTARNNRIGSKIHVKKIVIRQSVNICSFKPATVDYLLNSITYRLMVTDAATAAGTNINDFFSNGTCRDRMINPLNRRNYSVHYDKRFNLTSGYFNGVTAGATATTAMAGYVKYIQATIPVNRTIEYTDTGVVKECNDVYSVAAIATTPNYLNAGDIAPTVACVNSFVRIYYTDN